MRLEQAVVVLMAVIVFSLGIYVAINIGDTLEVTRQVLVK